MMDNMYTACLYNQTKDTGMRRLTHSVNTARQSSGLSLQCMFAMQHSVEYTCCNIANSENS